MNPRLRHVLTTLALAMAAALVSAQGGKTTADRIYTEEQAKRGEATYQKECAQCHMEDLRGEGFAPALNGDSFSQRWQKGVVGDLMKIVKGTMPADRPATLTPAQYADLISFLLKANGYPAGDQPLSENPADLAPIAFVKPEPSKP